MNRPSDPLEREVDRAHDKARDNLQNINKFKMFFTGLIFAILSFAGAHPIVTSCSYLKAIEVIGLFLIFISGTILLISLPYDYDTFKKLFGNIVSAIVQKEIFVWLCFIVGVFLLLLDRSIVLFI